MPLITEDIVMEFYLNLVKENHIIFLKEQKVLKKMVVKYIRKLQKDTEIHEKIQTAKELWKVLFEAAMTYIDPDKQGFDKLFRYFDQFVEFEELIFASSPFIIKSASQIAQVLSFTSWPNKRTLASSFTFISINSLHAVSIPPVPQAGSYIVTNSPLFSLR